MKNIYHLNGILVYNTGENERKLVFTNEPDNYCDEWVYEPMYNRVKSRILLYEEIIKRHELIIEELRKIVLQQRIGKEIYNSQKQRKLKRHMRYVQSLYNKINNAKKEICEA